MTSTCLASDSSCLPPILPSAWILSWPWNWSSQLWQPPFPMTLLHCRHITLPKIWLTSPCSKAVKNRYYHQREMQDPRAHTQITVVRTTGQCGPRTSWCGSLWRYVERYGVFLHLETSLDILSFFPHICSEYLHWNVVMPPSNLLIWFRFCRFKNYLNILLLVTHFYGWKNIYLDTALWKFIQSSFVERCSTTARDQVRSPHWQHPHHLGAC